MAPLRLAKQNVRRHSGLDAENQLMGAGDASDSSQNTCSTFSCPGHSNACENCTAWYFSAGYCCTQ